MAFALDTPRIIEVAAKTTSVVPEGGSWQIWDFHSDLFTEAPCCL
jgi:hypothetical protein